MFTKFVRNAFLPAAAAFFCMNAQAATPVTQCGQKLAVPGETYVFNSNLSCGGQGQIPTLYVQADNIKINLNGHSFTGNNVAAGFITSNNSGCIAVKGVEISNGIITGTGRAISICVPGSAAVDTQWHIHNLQIRGNGTGILMNNANRNEVNNVTMERLSLTNPNASGPKFGNGIEMANSSWNRIHNNSVNTANEAGIVFSVNSTDNDIKANYIQHTKVGIHALAGVKDNVIRANSSLFNTVDMQDDNFNPACGTDDWVRNTFTIANQFCIH
jgi:nitrous oxidase accessory protein NosD